MAGGFDGRPAPGCAPCDAPFENAHQSFSEVGRPKRPSGLFRGAERCDAEIICLIGNHRSKIFHAVEHGDDDRTSVIPGFKAGNSN